MHPFHFKQTTKGIGLVRSEKIHMGYRKGRPKSITRRKGSKGRESTVECQYCGRIVPRDKALEKTIPLMSLDKETYQRLKKTGATIHIPKTTIYMCVGCAKHRHVI